MEKLVIERDANSFWVGRTVFITGGSGFVGANLAGKLVTLGASVVCLERDRVSPNSLDVLDLREKVTVVAGSVEDISLIERILNEYQPDAVFHLAAQALVGAANRSPLATFEANIRGTYVLLEACRRSGSVSRIVMASSDKAYGSPDVLPYRENFPLQGVFPYDVSKSCSDMLSRSFAHTYELPVSVTRSANIYGPADVNLSRVVPGTIVSVLRNESPIIRSDGTPVREFIHIDDVVGGYLAVAESIEKTKGEAFNFGTNEPLRILDLVTRIIRLAGREGAVEPTIMLDSKIEREIDEQYLSGEKIASVLGWHPEITLETGLKDSIDWYARHIDRFA